MDKNEKTIKTIFVAEKANFFGKKVFSGERFRIKGLFYTSYNMSISAKLHVEGELFPLRRVEPYMKWSSKVKFKVRPQVKSGQGHVATEMGHIAYQSVRLAETNEMTPIPRL